MCRVARRARDGVAHFGHVAVVIRGRLEGETSVFVQRQRSDRDVPIGNLCRRADDERFFIAVAVEVDQGRGDGPGDLVVVEDIAADGVVFKRGHAVIGGALDRIQLDDLARSVPPPAFRADRGVAQAEIGKRQLLKAEIAVFQRDLETGGPDVVLADARGAERDADVELAGFPELCAVHDGVASE